MGQMHGPNLGSGGERRVQEGRSGNEGVGKDIFCFETYLLSFKGG